MKFLYEYRTKANELKSGSVSASSRDDAFAVLKARGIRPSRVTEAPGFFNKLFGKGKRWLAIVVLGALCLVLCVTALSISRSAQSTRHEAQSAMSTFDSPTRRQLIGDVAVIEKGIATGWADVFSADGDRFLASFAIPGHPPAVRTVAESALAAVLTNDMATVESRVPRDRAQGTLLEERQIRAIVAGMKTEINALLEQGWTLKEVGTALAKRQEQEISYYQRAKSELDAAWNSKMPRQQFMSLWEKRNAQLRRIGVKLVPWPED